MIRIQTCYHGPDGKGHAYPFWRNLIKHIHTKDKLPDAVWRQIFEEISASNGKFEEGFYILFENDEDATMFLLRWS
jgi:hypothetical protein